MHEEYYTFDSVLNQGMIPVNFDGCVNKLTKVITSCCNFSLVGLESTRKGSKWIKWDKPYPGARIFCVKTWTVVLKM